jgi:glucose/arabinose dehydrogenase
MGKNKKLQLKVTIIFFLMGVCFPAILRADAASRLLMAPGFKVSVFASDLGNSRGMALSPEGVLYVCEMAEGRVVALPDPTNSGVAGETKILIEGLHRPHSMAFYQGSLYVGETDRVARFTLGDHRLSRDDGQTIVPLPGDGAHFTRTILFGPDGKLYISIGSDCNVCEEKDERRATICRCNPDGTQFEIFARGLRNAVGIAFRPGTSELWATCNGRDWLGDDFPPETFYLVEQGKDYGWPYSYSLRGKAVPDPDLGNRGIHQNGFPVFEYQAHTAPLGITFYTGTAFPKKYQSGMFICFHGSWNRSIPVGYKVVFFPFIGKTGTKVGPGQDFLGFRLKNGEKVGRPVDVLTGLHGELFISDDTGGRIFKVVYSGNK